MSNFLAPALGEIFSEHHNYPIGEDVSLIFDELPDHILFQNNKEQRCIEFNQFNNVKTLKTSYYVGIDWLDNKCDLAIYVEPKTNREAIQTNYLLMLFSALENPAIAQYTDKLFEIKFDQPFISIKHQQDLLTPLLVVQFLSILKEIVRKGLKKSYYKVENNLYGRVKGKVMIDQTIKVNVFKNKSLNTYCTYEEFGWNSLENRLLKKTLLFVQCYLPKLPNLNSEKYTSDIFNYIMPAFNLVTEDVNVSDIKFTKTNSFYKEYTEAIRLAKLILRRFGYNINTTHEKEVISTPPFWIDMSKLFELYVLGLLFRRFGNDVQYHFTKYGNELDFLLKTNEYKMVIDAKYKPIYQEGFKNEDIRQISGYARLKSVYDKLEINYNELIDCLIIYPELTNGNVTLEDLNLKEVEINQYSQFYKTCIKLPTVNN